MSGKPSPPEKKKKEKDIVKINTKSAYFLFRADKINEIKQSHPNLSSKERLDMMSKLWKKMKSENDDTYKSYQQLHS